MSIAENVPGIPELGDPDLRHELLGHVVMAASIDNRDFFKFSADNGACVMVAFDPKTLQVLVADSKKGKTQPILRFTFIEWRAFIAGVKVGEFDVEELMSRSQPKKASATSRKALVGARL